MQQDDLTLVTVIYYLEQSLELLHQVAFFPKNPTDRIIIPREFKQGKSIITVCLGEVEIVNKLGDRILSVFDIA